MAAAEFATGRPGEQGDARRSDTTASTRHEPLFQPPVSSRKAVPSLQDNQESFTPAHVAPPRALPESVVTQTVAASPVAQAAAGAVSETRPTRGNVTESKGRSPGVAGTENVTPVAHPSREHAEILASLDTLEGLQTQAKIIKGIYIGEGFAASDTDTPLEQQYKALIAEQSAKARGKLQDLVDLSPEETTPSVEGEEIELGDEAREKVIDYFLDVYKINEWRERVGPTGQSPDAKTARYIDEHLQELRNGTSIHLLGPLLQFRFQTHKTYTLLDNILYRTGNNSFGEFTDFPVVDAARGKIKAAKDIYVTYSVQDEELPGQNPQRHELWHAVNTARMDIYSQLQDTQQRAFEVSDSATTDSKFKERLTHYFFEPETFVAQLQQLNVQAPAMFRFYTSLPVATTNEAYVPPDDKLTGYFVQGFFAIQDELPSWIAGYVNDDRAIPIDNERKKAIIARVVPNYTPFGGIKFGTLRRAAKQDESGRWIVDEAKIASTLNQQRSDTDWKGQDLTAKYADDKEAYTQDLQKMLDFFLNSGGAGYEVMEHFKANIRRSLDAYSELAAYRDDPYLALTELSLLPISHWGSYTKRKSERQQESEIAEPAEKEIWTTAREISEVIEENQQPATTVAYRGVRETPDIPHAKFFSKGFIDYEERMHLSLPDIEDMDSFLHDQIDRALAEGRDVVTVVDLGAGHSKFTRDFLENPILGERTRAILENSNIRLQFISVTDSETPDEHLQVTEFEEANTANNGKIDAKEVRYSITSSQNLKKLFEYLGVASVDLVVANNFMTYLTPNVFNQVTQDVIDALTPGGEFRVNRYASTFGSKLSRDDDEIPQDETVWLKKIATNDGPDVSTQAIIERCEALLSDANTTNQEIISAVQEIATELLTTTAFSRDEKSRMRRLIRAILPKNPRGSLADLLETVTDKENGIKLTTMLRDKNAILDNLQEGKKGAVKIRYRKHGIQIKKLASESATEVNPTVKEETLFEASPIPHFQPIETDEATQTPKDRFGNTVVERQFIGENGNEATEAYLVSLEGQALLRTYPALPSSIDHGIQILQTLSGNHAMQEVGLGDDIALRLHNNELSNGQSQTYVLEITNKKYLINKRHPEGKYHQSYSNEMLRAQTLAADNKEALDSANMTMGSYLFASSEMMCTEFEEGMPPRFELGIYEKFLDQYEKVQHVINDYIESQQSPLWENVYPNWKVNNFIVRHADGKFVFVHPFFYDPFFDIDNYMTS